MIYSHFGRGSSCQNLLMASTSIIYNIYNTIYFKLLLMHNFSRLLHIVINTIPMTKCILLLLPLLLLLYYNEQIIQLTSAFDSIHNGCSMLDI